MKLLARSHQLKVGPSRKRWRALEKEEQLMFLHLALITNDRYVPVHFSLRFSPSTEKELASKPHYARDEIRKVFNKVLGKNNFEFYFGLVVNARRRSDLPKSIEKKPLHAHGAVGVRFTGYDDAILKKLEEACTESPLSAKYRQRGLNKTADFSATFVHKELGRKMPLGMGWVRYIIRGHASCIISKSPGLTKRAKGLHQSCRETPVTLTVPISPEISGLEWIDKAPSGGIAGR
jgi:hypothetical protein